MASQPPTEQRYIDDPDRAAQDKFLDDVRKSPAYYEHVKTLQQTSEAIEPLIYQKNPAVFYCAEKDQWLNNKHPDPVLTEEEKQHVVHLEVAVFYDGTNNNLRRHASSPNGGINDAMTNVGRLFGLFKEGLSPDKKTYYASLYVRGVGSIQDVTYAEVDDAATRQRDAEARASAASADASSNAAVGGLVAASKDPDSFWSAPGRFMDSAKKYSQHKWDDTRRAMSKKKAGAMNMLGGSFGGGARDRMLLADAWIKDQMAGLPYLEDVNVATFGFSRGAATARAFTNGYDVWLRPYIEKQKNAKGQLITQSFRFAGLFDTVSSFDLGPSAVGEHNIHCGQYWKAGATTHLCAMDEFRKNFRLSLTGGNDIPMTGCHSDIGGGYGRVEQGKTIELAKVAMQKMHGDAVDAGVHLNPYPAGNAAQMQEWAEQFQSMRHTIWNIAFDRDRDKLRPFIEPDDLAWFFHKYGGGNPDAHARLQHVVAFFNWHLHLSHVLRGLMKGEVGEYVVNSVDDVRPGYQRHTRPTYDRLPAGAYSWMDPPPPPEDLVGFD